MKKIPAPPPKAAPKPPPEPPKERKPLVIETKSFDAIADAMMKATKAQGDATAQLQAAISAVALSAKSRSFEVEIHRDAGGMMSKLVISPINQSKKSLTP